MAPSIREQLRQLRKERGLTMRGLAALLGVTHSFISHVENGRSQTTTEQLEKWAAELGATVQIQPVNEADAELSRVVGLSERDRELLTMFLDALPKMSDRERRLMTAELRTYDEF